MADNSIDLARLFQAVTDTLIVNQEELNRADTINANHGDHMVEIFRIATLAALEKREAGLADSMEYAGLLLGQYEQNGSAQVYRRGLLQLAQQFRQRGLTLDDLLPYVRREVEKQASGPETASAQPASEPGGGEASPGSPAAPREEASPRSTEVLRALLAALSGWERSESGAAEAAPGEPASSGLDTGYLFGMGMAYLQAKAKGGDRTEVLAETVVSASPLGKIPHRARSGKLIFVTLLRSLSGMDRRQ